MNCREIAKQFKIGKTQAANVVKNEASLRAEYENIRGKGFKHLKRENHQKYKVINTILYKRFKKSEASAICVSGSLHKEEAMNIKNLFNNPDLTLKPLKAGLINGSLVMADVKSKYLASLLMYQK